MSSSFDDFSTGNEDFGQDKYIFRQNHYSMSGDFLFDKGYLRNEEFLRYTPFIRLINTGFGAVPDLRSQGASGTKFYINGILANNSVIENSGFSVLDTILPSFIESIDFMPGASSVLYGSGAKSGVVEIKTLTRASKPSFSIGAGYSMFSQGVGANNTYHTDINYKDIFFDDFYINLALAHQKLGGQRAKDGAGQMATKLGFIYDINEMNSLSLGVDFYQSKVSWARFNSLYPMNDFLLKIDANPNQNVGNLIRDFSSASAYIPSKEDRKKAYSSNFDPPLLTQDRLSFSLDFEHYLNSHLKFNLKSFYHFNTVKYKDSITGADVGAYKNIPTKNPSWNLGGSMVDEQKFGFDSKLSLNHQKGHLIFGTQNILEKNKNIINKQAINGTYKLGASFRANDYDVYNVKHTSKLSNALYALSWYDLTSWFGFETGARYELTSYKNKISDDLNIIYLRQTNVNTPHTTITRNKTMQHPDYSTSKSFQNIAFELILTVSYSNSGLIYAKYEKGFSTLPADFLIKRVATRINSQRDTLDTVTYHYEDTNLNDERYDSFELGFKDFFTSEKLTLLFSANAFYVKTSNEFYSTRNFNPLIEAKATLLSGGRSRTYSPNQNIYGTYDKTKRLGFEFAFEQYLFGGILGLNESINFSKASFYEPSKEQYYEIPYTYKYKATLGANLELFKGFNLWTQSAFFGKQTVNFKVVDTTDRRPDTDPNINEITGGGDYYLKAYNIIDIGVSMNFKDIKISAGVRNIADTLYFDYYNLDRLDPINNYGYILGNGRTFFIEGRYTY